MSNGDLRKECESILTDHDALDLCVVVEARRREDIFADIRLVFADRKWLQSAPGQDLVTTIRDHPMTAKAQRKKSAIHIRFHDELLGELERDLAAGEPTGMAAGDIAAGKRVTVSYVGPNTNKALHVGHLRNVFLGEALASALSASGAEVRRYNVIGDIGRRVCEAMAGYTMSHEGEDPAATGIPGDRFVELCCRDFAASRIGAAARSDDDPNAEERVASGDMADLLLADWMAGSAAEVELWQRMRDWVLDGHEETLGRLGVRFDDASFESDAMPRAGELVAEGVEKGIFEEEESGGVVYRTGQDEYPTMVLLRDDRFPTEHARLLGLYDHLLEHLREEEAYVELAGIEWQPSISVIRELREKLRPGPDNEADIRVFHGSVTGIDGEKIGSSTGDVVWVGDFYDQIKEGPAATALEQLGGGRVSREEIADLLIRGTFLCAPLTKNLAFAPEALMDGWPGPGWTIAEAWCRAQHFRDAEPQEGPLARTVVMQSQQFRLSLRRTVENHDPTSLARYLLGLSEVCVASPNPGPAAAPMLERVLCDLGFLAGRPVAATQPA
jgi:arginyl-tRNA synthetase